MNGQPILSTKGAPETRAFASEAKVGERSVRNVGICGSSCHFRRHLRGCPNEVYGYLSILAGKNPDRFAYPHIDTIVDHARRPSGSTYGRAQVCTALRILEGFAIRRAWRKRKGCWMYGWTVRPHDAWTTREGGNCVVVWDRIPYVGGKKLAPPSALPQSANWTPSPSLTGLKSVPNWTPDSPVSVAQHIEPFRDENFQDGPSLIQPYSIQPYKREPETENQKLGISDELNKPEVIQTQTLPIEGKPEPQTLKEFLDSMDESGSFEGSWSLFDLIRIVSFERFDQRNSCLVGYANIEGLRQSLLKAINEINGAKFLGKLTCADLMSSAMKILRREHGANAPRGWLIVIRQLRKEARSETETQRLEGIRNLNKQLVSVSRPQRFADWVARAQAEAAREQAEYMALPRDEKFKRSFQDRCEWDIYGREHPEMLNELGLSDLMLPGQHEEVRAWCAKAIDRMTNPTELQRKAIKAFEQVTEDAESYLTKWRG